MLKLISVLTLTWHVLAEVPTDEERKAILECHTKLREHVNPPASNMMLMNYSIEMENLAVKYFANCRLPVDREPFQGTSELLMDELPERPQFVQQLCQVNGNNYDYVRDQCNAPCSDYNLMAWAVSTQVGCALKTCPNRSDDSKSTYTLVCLYKPGDDSLTGRPYESGRSCSQCPDGYTCRRNQCYKGIPPTTSTSIAMPTTSIGAVLPTVGALIFAVLLLHCLE
uniref:SCP domain-containing protein n=1 Tax=Mesocestoides corti TaxID=53468 RepID=A0A5K3G168_MESCO